VGRLFILGAGFSKPAGLPLMTELLDQVIAELEPLSRNEDGWTHVHGAVKSYRRFMKEACGIDVEVINIEEFVEYLDHQHWFGLLGSDTWSDEGNQSQVLLRWGIGRVLNRLVGHEPPDFYVNFARRLQPRDTVISFNYDLLLERSLDRVGTPYRRFPNHYAEVRGSSYCTIDSEADEREVLILKPHGSIDWLSRSQFDRTLADYQQDWGNETVEFAKRRDQIFGPNRITEIIPLTEGPRPEDDPLNNIIQIQDVDNYYEDTLVAYAHPPYLLAPSKAKQLYGTALRDFWKGMGQWGMGYSGLNIIGYSLSKDDNYVRQVLWELVRGYTKGLEDPGWRIFDMGRIQIVDFRQSSEAVEELKDNFRFVPSEHTDFHLGGFNADVLDSMFPVEPYRPREVFKDVPLRE
jgi:hypothetical protein